jgi:putative transposase
LKREPSEPSFETKTPCRIDSRTGRIEESVQSVGFPLWLHLSTLRKRETVDIPLNPSRYHLKQLQDAKINDFEIVKRNKKYYVHISISKEIPDKIPSSIGGIDQGLNRTIAVVLLPSPSPETDGTIPHKELICDSAKRDLIDKYDLITASCQRSGATKKLKQLRNKRTNVTLYHDWCLAKQVAEYTEGYHIAIGNARFHQTQYSGNGMLKLRERIGKWSYGRQRKCITLKRAEMGYPTELLDEQYTSKTCHACGSRLVHNQVP